MITHYRFIAMRFACAAVFLAAAPVGTAHAQSTKVAIVTNTFVQSGGNFPTTTTGPTGSFTSFSFVNIPAANVNLANLTSGLCGAGGCDTVLLSVGSAGLNCNVTGALTATQRAALVLFVQNGGKLIIYDSECPSQNYNWLPYPFTTVNPGPEGAKGLLNIVENNALSSNVPADPKFINEVTLETIGDAVGDANVMTTQHPAWCLDLSATNTKGVTGPVQTYARYGSGLFIYNGLDLDPMNTNAIPNSALGPDANLAKIWLQQLQVRFNPTPQSDLPCGIAVIGITLAPLTATNDLGLGQTTHTVTATLTDLVGAHPQNVPVTITITSGPNAGLSTTGNSNAAGQVSFPYPSNGTLGTDQIVACFLNQGNQVCSQIATKTWVRVQPRLSISKNASPPIYSAPNTIISYTYQVSNSGNVTVNGPFTVNDDKAIVTCPATVSLAPGASIQCSATYLITQADLDAMSVTNTATATNGSVTSDPATATVVGIVDPELTIDKSATPSTYDAVGNVITYSYQVMNSGNMTLNGPFTVNDNKATVTCPATASLAPGVSITCTASHVITQADIDAGLLTNTATASNGTVTSPPDSATVNAILNPLLTIEKSATPTTYSAPGNVISYSYVVTNVGNVTLSGPFAVSDDKATDESCPATPTLAPGGSITCTATYTIVQADLDAGSVTNVASATGSLNGNPVTSPNDTATVIGIQDPRLSIDKTATPPTYTVAGAIISYSYVVTNTGTVTLSGPFTVSDDKAVVSCPATATLAPQASITCTASYAIVQADVDGGLVTNVASASGSFNGGPVTSPTDSATVTAIWAPGLTVEKTATPPTYIAAGVTINYSYLITNSGNVTLTGPFTVSDNKATVTCPAVASLAPQATMTCTASYVITQADLDGGSVTNLASASGTFNGAPVTSPNDSATVTAVWAPGLTVDKTATPPTYSAVGNIINYSYAVKNVGNVTLIGPFTVTDDKVSVTCPAVASLAPQASIVCTASYTITQADLDAGAVTNSASARGTFNGNPVTSPPDTVTVPGGVTLRLTLSKSPSPPNYTAAGQIITYTLTAANAGNATLHNVSIGDQLIGALDCVPPQPATLAPSQLLTCTGSYTVTPADLSAGSIHNTAGVSGLGPQNQPVGATADATVPANLTPGLSLTKTANPPAFNAIGQTITFTLVASNVGNAPLTNVTIIDPLIGPLTCVPPQPAALEPGQSLTCTGTHIVTPADLVAGQFSNTAGAVGTPPNDPPVDAQTTLVVPGAASDILDMRLTFTACTIELQQDWIPHYTMLQFEIWNEDEVKFTGAYECSNGWHETRFGTDFDASRQNFTKAVLGTDTARYRVQPVRSAQCPGSQAMGMLGVQSSLLGPNVHSVGSTLAGAGKFPGQIKWDPREFVPEGGIK